MRRFRQDPTQDYSSAEIASPGRTERRIRQNLERFGLKVICMVCDYTGRHWPKRHGRLRDRDCPRCRRSSTMVSIAWAEKNWARFEQRRDETRRLFGLRD